MRKGSPPRASLGKRLLLGGLRRLGYDVVHRRAPDYTPDEVATIEAVRDRTMLSPEHIVMVCRCVEYLASKSIPGAVVECGVWRGGAVMAALRTLLRLDDTSRDVYLYDTFAGMTAPTEMDVSWDGRRALDVHAAHRGTADSSNLALAPLEDVRRAILDVGYPAEKIHFVAGRVEDTIPGTMPDRIALLRLDTDWYESTRHELIHLYPRLSRAGVLIIDDYGFWAGSKKAVDEYIAAHKLRLMLFRSDPSVRYAIKVDD